MDRFSLKLVEELTADSAGFGVSPRTANTNTCRAGKRSDRLTKGIIIQRNEQKRVNQIKCWNEQEKNYNRKENVLC